MKGILFKPDVWKGKQRAMEELGLAVTRRVIKFKPFPNIVDSDWHAPWLDNVTNEWVFTARFGLATRSQRVKPRYQVGETVYIKEVMYKWTGLGAPPSDFIRDRCFQDNPQWYGYMYSGACVRTVSPLFMPEWAARYFIKITDVRAEMLRLPLSPEELEREGGDAALKMLELIDGEWVFRYEFKGGN